MLLLFRSHVHPDAAGGRQQAVGAGAEVLDEAQAEGLVGQKKVAARCVGEHERVPREEPQGLLPGDLDGFER